MTPRVVHLIQCLSRGGAARALIGAAGAVCWRGAEHRVVSLEKAVPQMAALAREHGLTVVERPDRGALEVELRRADIVQVHFWNTPDLYAVLMGPQPPARIVLWCHVAGEHAPHVLTPELLKFADLTVATTTYTLDLPALRKSAAATATISPAGGWDRVRHVRPRPHQAFNVGYIGTVDFTKMHPSYVAMSARVEVPEANFIVCGSGNGFATLDRQAAELGVSRRFELRGYVEDVASVISRLDVFGYPLCERNYATGELALQEAMYCGVPPVILAHGAAQRLVAHERTGLVATDELGYSQALERLHASPDERRQLGVGAREHAREAWDLSSTARRWGEVYDRLGDQPKRQRSWPEPPSSPGACMAPAAARFVQSLGDSAPEFQLSLSAEDQAEVLAAEQMIAAAPAALASADGGGVLHWRRRHPSDPLLHLWSGLVLGHQGHFALAAGEFVAAKRLGFEPPRVRAYLERCQRDGARPKSGAGPE